MWRHGNSAAVFQALLAVNARFVAQTTRRLEQNTVCVVADDGRATLVRDRTRHVRARVNERSRCLGMSATVLDERSTDRTNNCDMTQLQTILVVEDEVLIRVTAADALRDHGYNVVEVANGDDAVSLLSAGDVEIDLVFSDVRMPGVTDGFSLARWVRSNRPDIGVLLTSGYIGNAARSSDVFAHGPLLSKPYDHQELVDRIQKLLEG
jgi:CheY-like chemotaxis protein